VTVVSRFVKLSLKRQVLSHHEPARHVMPGNAVLPPHEGVIITRGIQEWACLLPGELPFASAARLLGWQISEERLLSDTMLRMLVRQHGQLIRQAEAAEVQALWEHPHLLELEPQLVAHRPSRLRAGWPEELNAAVDKALTAGEKRPPEGVTQAHWDRVLDRHRQDEHLSAAQMRRLGPAVTEDEILVTADEVLTRKPEAGCFWELRTARVVTATGSRYFSGTGEGFLQRLFIFLLILGIGRHRSLLFIADGARWIRNFFSDKLAEADRVEMILDWYHLHKKGYQLSGMICQNRQAKGVFMTTLYYHLWRGEVSQAIQFLQEYSPQAKNTEKLAELIAYLQARQLHIPNYQERRRQRQYIGSGHAEKGNDLMVARRQKKKGMHWSLETSDALAALKTLILNDGWELYWSHRQVLPLVRT
jgi:hypothetical protein